MVFLACVDDKSASSTKLVASSARENGCGRGGDDTSELPAPTANPKENNTKEGGIDSFDKSLIAFKIASVVIAPLESESTIFPRLKTSSLHA